jgi:hypothetical protein
MAITFISQPSALVLAGNPVIVKAHSSVTGKTFMRIVLAVTVNVTRTSGLMATYQDTYTYPLDEDGTATIDIHDSLQSVIRKEWMPTLERGGAGVLNVKQTVTKVEFSYTATEKYLDGIDEHTGASVASETHRAIAGAQTDMERLLATSEDTLATLAPGQILSRKPESERIPADSTLLVPCVPISGSQIQEWKVTQDGNTQAFNTGPTEYYLPASIEVDPTALGLTEGAFEVYACNDRAKSKYLVPASEDYREFRFVNSFGLMESVVAECKEALSYSLDSEVYEMPMDVAFNGHKQVASLTGKPYGTLAMSSGFVNREWADWWVNEFLTAEKVYLREGNVWLPVAVVPDDTVKLYDRTKTDLVEVDFDIRYSFEGSPSRVSL